VGRVQDAERYAEQARSLNATPKPLWILGRARQALGDYDAARSYWDEAVSLDASFVPALRDLGQFYLERDDPVKALEFFERAITIDPDHQLVRQGIEAARHQVAERDQAIHSAPLP
jgi:tetratricopeptide (TPR) repeat protein